MIDGAMAVVLIIRAGSSGQLTAVGGWMAAG